jgi:hypothetical protein
MEFPCYARPKNTGRTAYVRKGQLHDETGLAIDGRLVDESGEPFATLSDPRLEGCRLLIASDGLVYLVDIDQPLPFGQRYQVMRRALGDGQLAEWGLQLWPVILVRDASERAALSNHTFIGIQDAFKV